MATLSGDLALRPRGDGFPERSRVDRAAGELRGVGPEKSPADRAAYPGVGLDAGGESGQIGGAVVWRTGGVWIRTPSVSISQIRGPSGESATRSCCPSGRGGRHGASAFGRVVGRGFPRIAHARRNRSPADAVRRVARPRGGGSPCHRATRRRGSLRAARATATTNGGRATNRGVARRRRPRGGPWRSAGPPGRGPVARRGRRDGRRKRSTSGLPDVSGPATLRATRIGGGSHRLDAGDAQATSGPVAGTLLSRSERRQNDHQRGVADLDRPVERFVEQAFRVEPDALAERLGQVGDGMAAASEELHGGEIAVGRQGTPVASAIDSARVGPGAAIELVDQGVAGRRRADRGDGPDR